jgi:predicted HTH transcriptional regulator
MPKENSNTHKELFARFCEERSREALREFLKNHTGEQSDCDFKGTWPEFPSIAKHILGIANSGGGCVIVGIEEKEDKTFEPTGLASLIDKADFNNGVHSFLPVRLRSNVTVEDFKYEASEYAKIIGKKFQVIFVTGDSLQLPYVSLREGTGIRRNAIYVRRQGMTEEANDEELQQLINARLSTGYSSNTEIDLRRQIEELKILYDELAKWNSLPLNQQISLRMGHMGCDPYDRFLAEMVRFKCLKLQNMLINH